MKLSFVIPVLTISLLTLLAACGGGAQGGGTPDNGTLSGIIKIGPVCPVEPCGQPAIAIDMDRELVLSQSGGSSGSVSALLEMQVQTGEQSRRFTCVSGEEKKKKSVTS